MLEISKHELQEIGEYEFLRRHYGNALMRVLQARQENNSNASICTILTALTHIRDSSSLTDINNDGSITLMCETFLRNIVILDNNNCIGLCKTWQTRVTPFINSINGILKERKE